jgi:sporulation protein YlmC with PRC-barrel domain
MQSGQGGQGIQVSELEGMDAVNETGEQLGSVSRVVEDTNDGQIYVIIGHGGFLGLGEKEIAMNPQNLHVDNDGQVVVSGLTEEQIEDMPAYEHDEARFRELEDEGTVQVRTGS